MTNYIESENCGKHKRSQLSELFQLNFDNRNFMDRKGFISRIETKEIRGKQMKSMVFFGSFPFFILFTRKMKVCLNKTQK